VGVSRRWCWGELVLRRAYGDAGDDGRGRRGVEFAVERAGAPTPVHPAPTPPSPTQQNTTPHHTTQHNTTPTPPSPTPHHTTQHNTTQHNTTQHQTLHTPCPQHPQLPRLLGPALLGPSGARVGSEAGPRQVLALPVGEDSAGCAGPLRSCEPPPPHTPSLLLPLPVSLLYTHSLPPSLAGARGRTRTRATASLWGERRAPSSGLSRPALNRGSVQ
jgi:hypothetical protein